MASSAKVKAVKTTPTKKRSFFNFNRKKFSRLARDYHHEIVHLTGDLRRINQIIQVSALLSNQQINLMKRKNTSHLISETGLLTFEDTQYHVENFSFRLTGYRDKLVQFINQALKIGFDETTMGILGPISKNRTIKDAHLDTEIKKFQKDKDFKEVLSERILMTHRRYYGKENAYSPLMTPNLEGIADKNAFFKNWKQNVLAKANRTNRLVLKTMDMNDRVMEKINSCIAKNKPR